MREGGASESSFKMMGVPITAEASLVRTAEHSFVAAMTVASAARWDVMAAMRAPMRWETPVS